jgi:hypothetical protein
MDAMPMQYIAQKDEHGCLRAALAMILDMTYDEVARSIPLQTQTQITETGYMVFDRVIELLSSKGLTIESATACNPGTRYLAVSWDGTSVLAHSLAVDESGTVFDPLDSSSRKHWSEIPAFAFLALRPLSVSSQLGV